MEEEKQCILVIVGATDKGQKELIAIADGYRESEQSWLEVLLDLKRRGLEMGPQLALGDGALGFWKALRQVYPGAREQRCWVHKTGNVLNKLPKGLQKKAKGRLQDIWMAETRKDAESAFDFFLEAYGPKYDKAAACLAKDRDVLLTFYDFPAEHWKHVRTTNPIERRRKHLWRWGVLAPARRSRRLSRQHPKSLENPYLLSADIRRAFESNRSTQTGGRFRKEARLVARVSPIYRW